jgi:hypothetical protein
MYLNQDCFGSSIYTQKPLVIWFVHLKASLVISWIWSYRCVFFVFCLFSVFPSLVLSVASWGSVNLAVSSSLWEWIFLYSYERYSTDM